MEIRKYPRTRHIEGSRLQPGDEDLKAVRWRELRERFLVVEEKLDGANSAISFSEDGSLRLQSRGHYLRGGPREKHFAFFKTWTNTHRRAFAQVLGSRYVLYGEWLYAKHTIFYDQLPHYFMEFDVLDREADEFLSTERRRALLGGLPVCSVPVLHEGPIRRLEDLTRLVASSLYKSAGWKAVLEKCAEESGVDPMRARRETDPSSQSEGIYVKREERGIVAGRYKWVRASFLTSVVDSGSHWFDRPIIPNQLAPGVDIFAS